MSMWFSPLFGLYPGARCPKVLLLDQRVLAFNWLSSDVFPREYFLTYSIWIYHVLYHQHFPGSSVGKESACNAGNCLQCRGREFDPWSRKILHATGKISPCTTTTEPMGLRAHSLQQEKPLKWETCTLQLESSLCSPPQEKGHEQQWRASAAKNK